MPPPKPSKRYLRRSERVGEQVKTHYLGLLSDPVNRIIVQSEALSHATLKANNNTAMNELAVQERLEICQQFLAKKINRMVWLFRQRFNASHAKPRHSQSTEDAMQAPPRPKTNPVNISRDDWDEIVAQAADGDKLALEELKGILRFNPQICERLGDLNRHIQVTLIEIIGADSIATREALKIQIDTFRQTLITANVHPLERLLIEQVITTQLDLSIQQLGWIQPHANEKFKLRWERRMNRAHKRHLAAVTALAEFRDLAYGEISE